MIELEKISRSFGSVQAVDDISFCIKPGEIVGLLGPNGAGKTTTMRLMAGYLIPDQGLIRINGIDIEKDSAGCRRLIGYLPENNPLYKDMLVSDFLKYSAGLNGIESNLGSALDFVVESVNIENVFYWPISQLSKGYKQRVGIAAALIHKPNILIMDEPSEGLDPNQRTEIRALIRKLSKDHTIIISTHVMQEVEAVCSRMIIVNKGRLVADGTPGQLMRRAFGMRDIIVDIEGKDVEKKLGKITSIEKISSSKNIKNRFSAVLTVKSGKAVQPDISKIATKEGWTIWKISEEEKQLEDVFHLLTK